MEQILQFEVSGNDAGKTLREVLQKSYGVSRRLLVRAKYDGQITVNGVAAYVTKRVEAGDRVTLAVASETAETLAPERMPLAIRYEDSDLLVIAKPPGLVVHPTRTHESGTLANGVVAYWLDKGEQRKFRPVNRLDKDTSGLILIAKNQWTHEQCSRMQKERTIKRNYIAVVHGIVEQDQGVIDAPIGLRDDSIIVREVRTDGQAARTAYTVLARQGDRTWVELELETGRTHQIRVHMSSLGHPLLGDDLYGGSRELIGRQALHAARTVFPHPRTGRILDLREPLPDDMRALEK